MNDSDETLPTEETPVEIPQAEGRASVEQDVAALIRLIRNESTGHQTIKPELVHKVIETVLNYKLARTQLMQSQPQFPPMAGPPVETPEDEAVDNGE